MQLKLNDKVKLRRKSQYYNQGPDHPNSTGKIYSIGGDDHIFVEWPNGRRSVYSTIDLETESLPPPIPMKCSCEIRKVMNFGCKCEAGLAELERERG